MDDIDEMSMKKSQNRSSRKANCLQKPQPLNPLTHPQHPLAHHTHPHAHPHHHQLQLERERLEALHRHGANVPLGGAGGLVDAQDERSRSPLVLHSLGGGSSNNNNNNNNNNSNNNISGSSNNNNNNNSNSGNTSGLLLGGTGSSISGDQASTIDDSDSDDCGGKDDDGEDSMKNGSSGANGDSHLGLSLSKKQRKARTAFTDHQLQTLEKSFERQKYLSVQDRMELANKLELSDCQVKTWYQNRRTKWKRQTAVGLELLAEAGNYAAFQRLYGSATPYLSAWPYAAAAAAQTPHGAPPSAIDIYYRQAAAAAALQKPALPATYMYPSRMPPGMGLPGMPPPPGAAPMLGGYYAPPLAPRERSPATSQSANSEAEYERSSSSRQRLLTPSPPLNPGSPPPRRDHGTGAEETSLSSAAAAGKTPPLESERSELTALPAVEVDEDEDDEELALEV